MDQTYNIINWQTLFTWLWRWLLLRLSKHQSPTRVLFRTTLTWTITLDKLLILLGSNHLLCNLRQVILEGWPNNIQECDPVLHPFFQFHDALIVHGNLVFHGPHLIVLTTLRKEFMFLAHSSHNGLGGAFTDFTSAWSGPEWVPKWRISRVSVMFALHIMTHKYRNHYFNTNFHVILGQGCCRHLFSLRPNSAGCCQLFQ